MSNYDPTLDEMREYLNGVMADYEASEFDREEAIYWFAAEYHMGQSSNLYAALSASNYRPGALARGPSGMDAIEMYHALIGEYVEPTGEELTIDADDDRLEKGLAAARVMLAALRAVIDAGRYDDDGNFVIDAGRWDGKGDPPDVCDPPALTAAAAAIKQAEDAGILPK